MSMFAGRDVAGDARRAFDVVAGGGIVVFPTVVGYAVIGHTDEAIARIFEAKRRSFDKPCGWFGNWDLFNEVIDVDDATRALVDAIVHGRGLPFSLVAPFRPGTAYIGSLGAFALRNASKPDGTIDLLLNAGELHTAIATLARRHNMAVVGSSANQSLTGSKFRLQDVESEVLEAAGLCIDYGLCTYHNERGLGSTIVDLRDLRTLRLGCVYDEICEVVEQHAGVDLKAIAD